MKDSQINLLEVFNSVSNRGCCGLTMSGYHSDFLHVKVKVKVKTGAAEHFRLLPPVTGKRELLAITARPSTYHPSFYPISRFATTQTSPPDLRQAAFPHYIQLEMLSLMAWHHGGSKSRSH
jgi:hypothetical protein